MSYTEPRPALSHLQVDVADSFVVTLSDGKVPVEIRHIDSCGWSIEVRYDTVDAAVRRQAFTGAQERLVALSLTVIDDESSVRISAGSEHCVFQKKTGMFALYDGERCYFESASHPFTGHVKPVEIYENILSLKVTEFDERAPFAPKGSTFKTHMSRFQYPLPKGVILGLPGQAGEMNRSGYRFELYNTDEFYHLPNRKPLYQSWPIIFHADASGEGWIAVFHDNPTRTFVDLGDFYRGVATFESQSGNTRVYLARGRTLADASEGIARLLGGMELPPLWAFGYQQCRWSYMSTDEITRVAASLRAADIPCDAMYFDIDYMDGFRVFTRNPKTFAHMKSCIDDLQKDGFHSVCIIDPGVKIDPKYSVYKRLLKADGVLTDADGAPFEITCWPGKAVLPDFGDANIRSLWGDMQKEWLEQFEFEGLWNDMNEPANFDGGNATTSKAMTSRGPVTDEWNLYGYNMARASREGYHAHTPDKRPVVISRSGYPGIQQHAVIWHGDNHAWWEHLRLAIDATVEYALAGAYYTGSDIPGFTGNPSDDLAVRFFQLGALMPLFRGHSMFFSKDKEPYAYGEEANGLIKEAIRLRYSLLRQWYSCFEKAIRTYRTPIEPVLDIQGTLVRDHVLLFGIFLIAPVIERDQTQKLVYLPAGDWYRFGDASERLEGGRWLQIPVSLASVPMFVRAGSIVVRNTIARTTNETFAGPEAYDMYPDASGHAEGYWYSDDGVSPQDPMATRFKLTWSSETKEVQKVALS